MRLQNRGKPKKYWWFVIPFPEHRRFMKNCGKGTILCGCYIPVLFAETVIYWNKRLWSFQNRMKWGSGSPRRSLKPVWISILIFCTRKCVQQTACCSVWEDVTGREEGFLNFPIFLYMITKMEAEVFTRRTCISDRWKSWKSMKISFFQKNRRRNIWMKCIGQKRYGIQNITGKFKTVWRNSRRSIRRNILYRKRRCAISRALRSFRIPSMKKIKNCLKK